MPPTRKRQRRSRRGISRIDQPSTRTHGFFGRMGWHRRRDGTYGPRYQAFFGDVTHGGKRGALRAAQKWVAKVEALLSGPKRKRASRRRAASRRRTRG